MTTGAEALQGGEAVIETPAAGETPAPAAAAPDGASVAKWYADLPATQHGYIENKGWGSPADVLESYTNLEKLNGVPADAKADALLLRPKADATPEDIAAFIEKASGAYVPATAADYGNLGLDVKDGEALPPEIEQARNWMKEAGIPAPMAPKLVAAYQADLAKAEADFQTQSTKDMTDLATDFGAKAEDNFELGRRAFRAAKEQAGIGAEHLAKIERAIGTSAMMKMFISMGKNQVEMPGGGAPGNAGNSNSGFSMSAEGAKAKATSMRQDSAFLARYNSPNIGTRNAAIAEIEAVDKVAAGSA